MKPLVPDWERYGREAFSRGAGIGAAAGFVAGLVIGAGAVVLVRALTG